MSSVAECIGVGVDFVSVERIHELWIRHRNRLAGDIFCDEELQLLRGRDSRSAAYPEDLSIGQLRYLATRFAAKEAAYKALSPPATVAYDWCEIRIIGERIIKIELAGNLKRMAKVAGIAELVGSTASTESSAMAIVVRQV